MNNNLDNIEEYNFDRDFPLFIDKVESFKNKEGDVVKGKVIGIRSGFVVVDIGIKSEGRIPIAEFKSSDSKPNVNIGDEFSVLIEKFEGRNGVVVLSREKAFKDELWAKFEMLYQNEEMIEGRVIGRVKGGFAVDLDGMIGFLPGSQVDIKIIKDSEAIIGVTWSLKILKMDKEHGNIVVSRRAILEESRKEARMELLSKIKEGTVIEGIVKNITEYGAFLDFGAIDGLLHITHISWNKVGHPSEVLSVGQKLSVIVIKYHEDTQRISVGLKQLSPNPWEKLKDKYVPGSIWKGKVTSTTDYGAFICLEVSESGASVEGLVYHTEIHWTARNTPSERLLSIGQEVNVSVLDIDIDRHRISLSVKRCLPNTWVSFIQEHPVGTIVDTVVSKVTDFGMFVILAKHVTEDHPINILIPASEFSWYRSENASLHYSKGDNVKCVITSADVERERIAASIRHLTPDPFIALAEKWLSEDSVVGEVICVHRDGIDVQLAHEVITFIHSSELPQSPDGQNVKSFILGQKVEVIVVEFDKTTRQFKASIKSLHAERGKNAVSKDGEEKGKNAGTAEVVDAKQDGEAAKDEGQDSKGKDDDVQGGAEDMKGEDSEK